MIYYWLEKKYLLILSSINTKVMLTLKNEK